LIWSCKQGRNFYLKSGGGGGTKNSTCGAHRGRRRCGKMFDIFLRRMVHFQPCSETKIDIKLTTFHQKLSCVSESGGYAYLPYSTPMPVSIAPRWKMSATFSATFSYVRRTTIADGVWFESFRLKAAARQNVAAVRRLVDAECVLFS